MQPTDDIVSLAETGADAKFDLHRRKGKRKGAKMAKMVPLETEESRERTPSKEAKLRTMSPVAHSHAHGSVKVYGMDIGHMNPTLLFIVLGICHICFSVIFAFFQEKVQLTEGYNFPKFMTLVQLLSFTVCAFLELLSAGGELGSIWAPKAPVLNYCILSLLTGGGMYFTNWGLEFLSYPTRIIFKAAKPVPTMALEWAYVGKVFSGSETLSVAILTFGIMLFCSGEARDAPAFHLSGVVLMMVGVILDSLTSNFEKKNIFNHSASHCEAMFFASLLALIWSTLTLLSTETQMVFEAIHFLSANPIALVWLLLSSIGAYLSVTFVLLLIKLYSTTYAECVKGMRKVISIFISYVFLGGEKAFGWLHFAGLTCFVSSIALTIYTKYRKEMQGKVVENRTKQLESGNEIEHESLLTHRQTKDT